MNSSQVCLSQTSLSQACLSQTSLFGNIPNNPKGIPQGLAKIGSRSSTGSRPSTMRLSLIGTLCSALVYSVCLAHTPLDSSKVIEFKISKSGLTRISIDNDSIEDVYAYPAEPDLVTHHKSGHVFVTPDDLEVPVYLTVITRRGAAQDLRLIPTAKKAEPILLRYEESTIDPLSKVDPLPSPPQIPLSGLSPQDASAYLLAQFIKGKVPPGFVSTTANEVSRGEGPIEAVLDKTYQNNQFRILVFAIKNESPERRTLDNKVFWGKGDLASAFDHPTLAPQETARLFVIQQR